MSIVNAPNGDETHVRAIVFKEGDVYVAQCLEYDISTQATGLEAVIARLELTIEAECAAGGSDGLSGLGIGPAPNYYHTLWDQRSMNILQVKVPSPSTLPRLEVGLAAAA